MIGPDHYARIKETLDSLDITSEDYNRIWEKLQPLNPDQTEPSGVSEDVPDACDNATGNGNQIVSGPQAPTDYDPDNPFRSLTVHPTDPNIIYLGTERNGFLKSTDGGQTWTRKRTGLWHDDPSTVMGHEPFYPEIYDIAYSESDPQIMYAAATSGPGPLLSNYPGPAAGVYKSVDGGDTWEWKSCGITSGWVWSVWVHDENPDIALVGISGGRSTSGIDGYYDGGIFRTTNGGETWKRVILGTNDNKNAYRVIVSAKENPNLVYTSGVDIEDETSHIGLYKSTDAGLTWTGIESIEYFEYFDISPDGQTIYGNLHDCNGGVISNDGGNNWRRSKGACYVIAVSPSDILRVLYGGYDGVYISVNGLIDVEKVADITVFGGGHKHVGDIVFAPSDNNIVYAITSGYDLYKSTNSGNAFKLIINLRNDVLSVIP
ncbi:MAG: hypothetical protein JRI49_06890 [Deltaproteobacteria bacterium]|nr:hypothetical protein [Deltaproteobacteria bacterium]